MVSRVRGRPGGRFRVTPTYNLVIVFGEGERGMVPYLAGRLEEPFRLRDTAALMGNRAQVELTPGNEYPGPTERTGGTYKLRQKRGGVIERKQGKVFQFAITETPSDPLAENGKRVLAAWQSLGTDGFTFYVNAVGDAWYRDKGGPRFLASVLGGFLWPSIETSDPGGGS